MRHNRRGQDIHERYAGRSVIQHDTDHRCACGEKNILPYVISLPLKRDV